MSATINGPLTFDKLHADAQSVIASNLNLSGLKALRATSKTTNAAADVQYLKLSNTLLIILFDTDTDTCLKTLCSHLKQALNRSTVDDPDGHQHVHLQDGSSNLDSILHSFNKTNKDNLYRLYHKVKQACEAVDKQIVQAQQKRKDSYKGKGEALPDDIDMEISLLKNKSLHFHAQETDLRDFVKYPQHLDLAFIKTSIVGHLLRDRNNFARNVVTLYNAYVVGSNSIRETSTFNFIETGDASKTQVVIKPTGEEDQSGSTKVETRYTFFRSDGVYNLSVQFVDNHKEVSLELKTMDSKKNNGIITVQIPTTAANARYVQTFIDSIKVLQTFSAVPGRSWYRTGPAFLSYIDTLLWSVNISKDDIKLKWMKFTSKGSRNMLVFRSKRIIPERFVYAASDIVDRVLATGYPFTWNKKLNCVDFRASFVDLCHVTSVKPLEA